MWLGAKRLGTAGDLALPYEPKLEMLSKLSVRKSAIDRQDYDLRRYSECSGCGIVFSARTFLAQIMEKLEFKSIKQNFACLNTATPDRLIESEYFDYLHKKLHESVSESYDSDSLFYMR